MNKIAKISFIFLSVLVAIALAILVLVSTGLLTTSHMSPWQYKLTILLGAGFLAGIITVFSKLKTKSKLLIILLIAFIIRLIWIINVKSVPVSDFLTIYNTAKEFLNGNVSQLRDYGYLARFPHLTPMMLYMAGMIKLFGPYHIIAMKCVGLALSVLSVYLIYKLSGYYIKSDRNRLIAALIASIYPSLVSYSSTYCTETVGVPLFLLSVILFHKAVNAENHKLLRFLECGAVLYFSNMFRGVAIIFLIAFGLFIFIFTSKNKIASMASIIVGYFTVSLIVSGILMATNVIEHPLWQAKEPSYATLMLKGSNFEHNGTWNLEDAHFVDEHLKSDDLSKKCFEVIRERLSERTPLEIAGFYGKKFANQWSIGDCSGTYWATFDTDTPFPYPLPIPFQATYVIVLILSLCTFVNKNKTQNLALMFLLLCGFGAAFMLLETQGRYSYVVSWIFIILSACGLESFSSDNEYFTKAINIYQKYKTQMNYIVFGIVTTISNIITYYILYNKLHIENVTATVIAWFVSVIVAYVTNKIWVFESKSLKPAILVKEVSSFFACRILTGFLDVGIMWIGVDLLLFNSTLLKIISNVIVVILNYVASKLFIFKNKNESDS